MTVSALMWTGLFVTEHIILDDKDCQKETTDLGYIQKLYYIYIYEYLMFMNNLFMNNLVIYLSTTICFVFCLLVS